MTAHNLLSQLQHEIKTSNQFGGWLREPLYRALPMLLKLEDMDAYRVVRIRRALGDLNAGLFRKKFFRASAFVTAVIFLARKTRPDVLEASNSSYNDGHQVSDHAFCAAIRRLGYDLNEYKNKALQEAQECGLIPVMHEKRIVTFLPKGCEA